MAFTETFVVSSRYLTGRRVITLRLLLLCCGCGSGFFLLCLVLFWLLVLLVVCCSFVAWCLMFFWFWCCPVKRVEHMTCASHNFVMHGRFAGHNFTTIIASLRLFFCFVLALSCVVLAVAAAGCLLLLVLSF
jgi:hypothetical protein